jgi:hypothetical protein
VTDHPSFPRPIRPMLLSITGAFHDFCFRDKGTFTRSTAADCYWMQSDHENIARTRSGSLLGRRSGNCCFLRDVVQSGFAIERIHEGDLNSATAASKEVCRGWCL